MYCILFRFVLFYFLLFCGILLCCIPFCTDHIILPGLFHSLPFLSCRIAPTLCPFSYFIFPGVSPVWFTSLLPLLYSIQPYSALYSTSYLGHISLSGCTPKRCQRIWTLSFPWVCDLDHSCTLVDGASAGALQYQALTWKDGGGGKLSACSVWSTQSICTECGVSAERWYCFAALTDSPPDRMSWRCVPLEVKVGSVVQWNK